MGVIIAFVLLGIFLLIVEMILLPGITVAGIASLGCCGYAVYLGFTDYGTTGGVITLAAVLVLMIAAGIICLRAKTWRRFTLKENIDSKSQETPDEDNIHIGDRGTTVSRLAPMGKVVINGKTYEAKSIDSYIDPKQEIEVTGIENFNVIVKRAETAGQ